MNEEMYTGFESYLANEMPSDERKTFEEKLQNDADFRNKFEAYKETSQFLNTAFSPETLAFKMNLEKISNQHFASKETSKVIQMKPWYYAVAASIAVIFGILFFNQGGADYNDYNQHQTAVFTERGDEDVNVKQAQDFFNAHDYKNAVAAFERIHLLKDEWQFYYAIALIETNSNAKAEGILTYFKNGTSVYKDKATWYLALSKLKQNKTAECKSMLEQIPTDAEDYEKAQQLLNDLD